MSSTGTGARATCALVVTLLLGSGAHAQTVADAISRMGPCQSHLVSGLSDQLLRTHTCTSPDSLVPFSHRNITMNTGVNAYGTPEMVAALYRVADGGALHVNSAFRTVVIQLAFYETDLPGGDDGCYHPASPGTSNHEFGNAVDIRNGGSMVSRMTAQGFAWFGSTDPVHFDYGSPRRGSGVLAFQRLWNLNNPGDRIEEDGSFGPITRSRLLASPAGGFPIDGCDPCGSGVGDLDSCGVALLLEQPAAYASPRTTDVNGDGRADLCARGGSGVRCWTASAAGWDEAWPAIPWSDAGGWDDVTNYATLRMGDVDGDGLADVCGRSDADFLCALSSGAGFAPAIAWREGLSDASGWSEPRFYTTLRLADVNGDGKDDLCARDAEGFGCWLSDGARFEERVEGPRWSDAAGFTLAKYYGTLRMGDVNGDRLADVCVRGAAGVSCALSDGMGFPTSVGGPAWSDASGFGARQYWSTLRLADVDGDGRDDLCIRTSTDLRCALSSGDGFGETVTVAALSDASGWADPANYRTLRTGDIDGDGAADLCLRSNSAMACWAWDGESFVQRAGPEWADGAGWGAGPQYYETVRLADFDGDGLEDLCARAGAGWRCHPSLGDSFGAGVTLDDLDDASGWAAPRYWSTIMSAGSACRAELAVCNGVDEDCDGMIDEGLPCAVDGGPSDATDGGMSGADAGGDRVHVEGCGCRASGAGGRAPIALLALLGLALIRRRRLEG